jgi:phosphoserine phosphatase
LLTTGEKQGLVKVLQVLPIERFLYQNHMQRVNHSKLLEKGTIMLAIFAAEKIIWEDNILKEFIFWMNKTRQSAFNDNLAEHLKKYHQESPENMQTLVAFFKGRNFIQLKSQAISFAKQWKGQLIAESIEKIYEAKALGKKVVLTSSSPEFLLKALLGNLPIDQFMGASLVTDPMGVCTGAITQDSRSPKNRIKSLKRQYAGHDISWCITGSYQDIPLLDLALDQKIVFNPDRELLSHAREKNWTVRFKKITF